MVFSKVYFFQGLENDLLDKSPTGFRMEEPANLC